MKETYGFIVSGVGLWLIISPWVLGFGAVSFAKWNNALIGLVLLVGGAWQLLEKRSRD